MKTILTVLSISALCSCTAYWNDRGRDAEDIFTLTAGTGYGAAVRCSALHAGLGFYAEGWGLRGGRLGDMGRLAGNKRVTTAGEYTFGYQEDFLFARLPSKNFISADNPELVFYGYPFLCGASCPLKNQDEVPFILPYYTQVDVNAAAMFGARFGFNPGELLDFLFGFTTLDIYHDDVYSSSVAPSSEMEKPDGMICSGEVCVPSDSMAVIAKPHAGKGLSEEKRHAYEAVNPVR